MAETKVNQNQLNIGNESALDLLIERNTAKSDLATNLQGKGINADASTETLNQLVNKVPDILSSSEDEIIPCISVGVATNAAILPDKYFYYKKKGYLFWINISNTNKIYYCKISDIEQNGGFNSDINVSSYCGEIVFSTNFTDTNTERRSQIICFNDNATKLFCCGWFATSNNLAIVDIEWDGDTIISTTISKIVTVTDKYIYDISSNSDGSKLLCSAHQYNGLYLYDVVNETATEITGLDTSIVTNGDCRIVGRWVGDNEIITASIKNNYWYIGDYSLEGSIATNLKQDSNYYISGNIYGNGNVDYTYGNGILIFKYDTNKYKIILSGGNLRIDRNEIKLVIFDSYTKEMTNYTDSITYGLAGYFNSWRKKTIDILYKNNKYIIYNGFSSFLVFDENWNYLNGISLGSVGSGFNGRDFGDAYFGEKSLILHSSSGVTVLQKIQYWFDKKLIVKRTVSIEGTTKTFYYYPTDIAAADIDAGYFD